jgi:NAD(P)-dependent dehydrogenase (short-subunit alcohol dehydrogenase family)
VLLICYFTHILCAEQVTGGNKGIGYAIAAGLCERFNGTVYLTARDEARGREAVAKLNKVRTSIRCEIIL